MKKFKKSQIQMGENVIILFIFFILLVFAVVFYTRIQSTKTSQTVQEDISGRALAIAQQVTFLPGLQCTKDNAEVFTGCYDLYGAKALNVTSEDPSNSNVLYTTFGFSTVTIKSIYPEEGNKFVIYNRTKDKYTSITATNVPLSLCDFSKPEGVMCSFAVLKVEVYN